MKHWPHLEKSSQEEKERERTSQIELMGKIFEGNLPVYLIGGYAEEAVLQEGPSFHHDVDVLALRKDKLMIEHKMNELGVKIEEIREGDFINPYKLIAQYKDTEVDIGLLDGGEGEDFYVDINAHGERFRIYLDAADLNFPDQKMETVTVRTVSPVALMKMRNAILAINRFSPREKDVVVQRQLREKFFSEEIGDGKFMPRIEKII